MPDEPRRLEGQHVQPAIRRGAAKLLPHELGEKPACRPQDAALFCGGDACRCAAIAARGALPHFHKYQERAVTHDQVQLAGATAQLTSQYHAACALEVLLRERFVTVSALLVG